MICVFVRVMTTALLKNYRCYFQSKSKQVRESSDGLNLKRKLSMNILRKRTIKPYYIKTL